MKISVITPTYNSEKNIAANVKSILNQTYLNFEHIIIDNLSSDSTLESIKSLYKEKNLFGNLHIISEKDYGISDAFNKGLTAAKGDIIAILNSDDYYYSDLVFERVVDCFLDKKVKFVHGNILFKDNAFGSNIRKPLLCDVRAAMPFNHPTMFLKKDFYLEIGKFDRRYKYAMDYDMVVKMSKLINNLEAQSCYISEPPLVVMNAGGASWVNEIKSVYETKEILKENDLWDSIAAKHYYLRIIRIRLKEIINLLGLNIIVKIWRKIKWS